MKKLILILFILLVSIIPISANTLPVSSYSVPWANTDTYIIYELNGSTRALSFASNVNYFWELGHINIKPAPNWSTSFVGGYYELDTVQGKWNPLSLTLLPNSTFNSSTQSRTINGLNLTNIKYWNKPLYDHNTMRNTLFPQAPFQLPLTPLQVAITGAVQLITEQFGVILAVGLVILSMLLAIRLTPRLIRSVIR